MAAGAVAVFAERSGPCMMTSGGVVGLWVLGWNAWLLHFWELLLHIWGCDPVVPGPHLE